MAETRQVAANYLVAASESRVKQAGAKPLTHATMQLSIYGGQND
jgi:hypothetical protein